MKLSNESEVLVYTEGKLLESNFIARGRETLAQLHKRYMPLHHLMRVFHLYW